MDKKEKNAFGKIPNKPYFVWIVIVCAIIMLVSLPRGGSGNVQTLDTKQLMAAVQNDAILEISLRNDPSAGKDWYVVEGKMKNPVYGLEDAPKDAPRSLNFVFAGRITEDMYKRLTYPTAPWEVKEVPSSTFWGNLVSSVLPFLIIVGVLYFLFTRQMRATGRGAMSFGKSRARLLSPDKDKVTFKDVAGCDESKEEVSEVVEFLKNPKRFSDIGARIPKGILMVGPPGTGKTLLARAVAGEADVPFYSISGSDFVEMFVGVGAARVRDMFEQARKTAPCLVFIDEIDAVGRQRGAGMGGGHDEREQTLNQLLVEMDGFAANQGVVVLAATNRVDILDPALLRPGRFDRQVYVGLPDIKGRQEILAVHAKNKPLAEDVDLEKLAKGTSGFTGADLENLLNEAALLAGRRDEKAITMADLQQSVIKVIAGPEKHSRVIPEHERRLTAYHEAGHAVVMHTLPDLDPVHQITTVPRGQAGGMTIFLPDEDRSYLSRTHLLNSIAGLLGGRAAEQLVLGDISTGASNDISRATQLARKMVGTYGMSDRMGSVAFDAGHDEVFIGRSMAQTRPYSEETAAEMDREIRRILDEAYGRCTEILERYRPQLTEVAEFLLQHETMTAQEFEQIFASEDKQ